MSAYTATPVSYWAELTIGQFLAWVRAEVEVAKEQEKRPKGGGAHGG